MKLTIPNTSLQLQKATKSQFNNDFLSLHKNNSIHVLQKDHVVSFSGHLSNEELIKLYRQTGNQDHMEKLITQNMGMLGKYVKQFSNKGIESEDLLQEGKIILFKTAQNFDFDKNIKFITYAGSYIKNHFKTALTNESSSSLGRHRDTSHFLKIKEELEKVIEQKEGLKREATEEEICKKMGIGHRRYKSILAGFNTLISIDAPIKENSTNTLKDLLAAGHNTESILRKIKLTTFLDNAIKTLNDREQHIIGSYFGLLGKDKQTQPKIAKDLGLTQATVSRDLKQALVKLRKLICKKNSSNETLSNISNKTEQKNKEISTFVKKQADIFSQKTETTAPDSLISTANKQKKTKKPRKMSKNREIVAFAEKRSSVKAISTPVAETDDKNNTVSQASRKIAKILNKIGKKNKYNKKSNDNLRIVAPNIVDFLNKI